MHFCKDVVRLASLVLMDKKENKKDTGEHYTMCSNLTFCAQACSMCCECFCCVFMNATVHETQAAFSPMKIFYIYAQTNVCYPVS